VEICGDCLEIAIEFARMHVVRDCEHFKIRSGSLWKERSTRQMIQDDTQTRAMSDVASAWMAWTLLGRTEAK
jgi:ribosome-binding protein aMBF1 (putative translation factor)